MSAREPVYHLPWGLCSTCGVEMPARFLRLNPRYGWQCAPGNPKTVGCWDGLRQRDEIVYYPPPLEGVRKTNAPPVPSSEGIDTDLERLAATQLRDRSTGQIWRFDWSAVPPTLTEATEPTPWRSAWWLASPSAGCLYVDAGLVQVSASVPDGLAPAQPPPGLYLDLTPDGLTYTYSP